MTRGDKEVIEDEATLSQVLSALKKIIVNQNERIEAMEARHQSVENIPKNTRLIGDLEKRIPIFSFNPESELSFADWYGRYEPIFTIDGESLDDKTKLRLLTEKLDQEAYRRFSSHILPKVPTEIKFLEAVSILKSLFDIPISIFKRQYDCWSPAFDKDPLEDDQTYADRINERFHKVMDKMEVEDLKVLRFLVGLKGRDDQIHLPYLLSYADKTKESEQKVTLQGIIKELTKQRTFKRDGLLIANSANQQINQIHKPANKNKGYNKSKNYKDSYGNNNKGQNNKEFRTIKKCSFCSKTGHLVDECYRKHPQLAPKNNNRNYQNNKRNSFVRAIKEHKNKSAKSCEIKSVRRFTDVIVNNTPIVFQADTGADVTILDIASWNKLGKPELKNSEKCFVAANKSKLDCKGKLKCNVQLNGEKFEGDAYIVRQGSNLLGLDWMQKSKKHQKALDMIGYPVKINAISNKDPIEKILLQNFPKIFEQGLGTCSKEKAHLKLIPGAVPVFCPPRKVPYAAQEAVEQELDRLLELGVIIPINYSQWAAPIVTAKKANGKIRVCIDFSTGLNRNLEDNTYPLPLPEDIFANLNGGVIFSQIDLSDAYFQIELDEHSRKLVVINTHRGLFQYNRLPFGIKTAPAIFQNLMSKMISGLPGVASYLDDILVTGKTHEEHDKNLKALFSRINDYGFRIKIEKCSFHKCEIKFLGYIIDKNGRRPDPDKISAITNMKKPINVTQLKSFLGLVSYYGQFLPKIKELRGPLDNLTHKEEKWSWSTKCDLAFQNLIKILSSDLNLCHYNPNLPVIVSADACEYGIGGVISHRFPDGKIKPIHHCSKALSEAEKNYSQIEKEGLALITAIKKFHKYIYGRKFLLQTDHKPLLQIYGNKKGLPAHTANRLIRWGTILLGYDFDIEYINTEKFGLADGLSRLMTTAKQADEDVIIARVEEEVNYNFDDKIRRLPLLATTIAEYTKIDTFLAGISDCVVSNNWNNNLKIKKDPEYPSFYNKRHELSIIQNCIIMGERIVIPMSLRLKVLKEIHQGHPGIVRMKKLAQSFVYWPKIDKDIENFVNRCENCQSVAKLDRKVPLNPWPVPKRVWQRVHADYAGPVEGLYYLVVVDSQSRWPEVMITKSISTSSTIRLLESVFSRNGLPEIIVTDNGTQFSSKEFNQMCQENGINHIFSPPYHPQSNGRAERFIDTLKRGIKKLKGGREGMPAATVLNKFLLAYRSTPCRIIDDKTPAEIFMGRRLRTTLSLMLPRKESQSEEVANGMKDQFDRKNGVKGKNFHLGDLVYYQRHHGNNWTWIPGKITRIRGKANYSVDVEGREHHCHANQLRRRADTATDEKQSTEWFDVMMNTFHLSPTRNTTQENTIPFQRVESNNKEPEIRKESNLEQASTRTEEDHGRSSEEEFYDPMTPPTEEDDDARTPPDDAAAVPMTPAPDPGPRRSTRTRRPPSRFADYC